MTDRLNISYCASSLARALHQALKAGQLTKIGIEDIRAAVIGYLAAGPHFIPKHDMEQIVEATLRKTVEMV